VKLNTEKPTHLPSVPEKDIVWGLLARNMAAATFVRACASGF